MLNQNLITVLIVDDHDLVRECLKTAVEGIADIKVIGEASSGEEAIDMVKTKNPQIVLMDIKMPGIGGLEASRRIIERHSDIKIIILTSCEDELFFSWSKDIGIQGYLTKGGSIKELKEAIKKVSCGEHYLSEELVNQVIKRTFTDKTQTPFAGLAKRELQIMFMLCGGMEVKDIASKLFLSPKTINSYRYQLFEKLNVKNDVELTHLAIRYGLINQEMFPTDNSDI